MTMDADGYRILRPDGTWFELEEVGFTLEAVEGFMVAWADQAREASKTPPLTEAEEVDDVD